MENKSKKKTQFQSEFHTIKCRISSCKLEILAKNYKQHLITKHPDEDSSDLSPFGQRKISFHRQQKQISIPTIGQKRTSDEESMNRKQSKIETKDTPSDSLSSAVIIPEIEIFENKSHPVKKCLCVQPDKFDQIVEDISFIKENVMKISEHKSNQNPCSTVNTSLEDEQRETLIAKVTIARSVNELELCGFIFYNDKNELHCLACTFNSECKQLSNTGIFKYDPSIGLEFPDDVILPVKFKNLKKNLKRHIEVSNEHTKNLQSGIEKARHSKRRKTKNGEAGMNLGRLCYKLFLKGRPYTDYEDDVLMLKQANANVGELNHSMKFPPAFLPHVTKEVKSRLQNFLTSQLIQTGHRPPLALSADKATYKHRSRQFLGGVTISPGSSNLLEIVSFGQPIVKSGSDGKALTLNMKEGFDDFGIEGCQVESTVFDGVYFHIGIKTHFDEAYGLKEGDILYSYDALHKTGLVDTHLCKKKEYSWVVSNTDTCQQIFTTFNWGANYEKLVAATVLWKLHLKSLVGFSETRFANSRRQVYINIHHEFPAIMTCLENMILDAIKNTEGITAPNARVREKGDKARELKGKILNVHFLLNLSGLADAYGQFGAVVNVAQMVHLLPHERYELYMKAVEHLADMTKCLSDHSKCVAFAVEENKDKTEKSNGKRKEIQGKNNGKNGKSKEKEEKSNVKNNDNNEKQKNKTSNCLWPLNHADKKTLKENNEIRGIPIISGHGIQAAGLLGETRRQTRQNQILKDINAEKKSDEQLLSLSKELYRGLKDEVYDEESVEVIKMTKVILDLPSLAIKIKHPEGGHIKMALTEFPLFINAVKRIPVRSLLCVPEEELKNQYKEFLRRLEEITKKTTIEDLTKYDPKELIKQFFNPSDNLFNGIEMVMQAMAVSSVKQSCESVLESMVSKYENHFSFNRNMSEDKVNDEFFVAVNGPSLGHCDNVIEKSMNSYWKHKEWHFYRTTAMDYLKDFNGNSKVLQKLLNEESSFKCMD